MIWERLQDRIYGAVIRLIRRYQDTYRRKAQEHQKAYEIQDERSFRALYHTIVITIYGDLYWFCIANARYKVHEITHRS